MSLVPRDPDPTLPRLPRASHSATRRTRVLALAADLADDLETVDLDVVDGEFFWRCCHADLLERAEALAADRPRPIGARAPRGDGADDDARVVDERLEPGGVFDYLRDGLRFAEDFLALADEAARLYPGVVWRRLLDGERVAMRAAEAEVLHLPGGAEGGAELRLRVFSGAWTGAQVEDELRRLADDAQVRRFVAAPRPPGNGIEVRLAFAFVDGGGDLDDPAADGQPRSPYVEVVAPAPLPPKGTVTREYDALVRGERGWHLALPGGGSKQEKEVAVRIWAVGLLVAAGELFGEAMHAVAGREDGAPVGHTRADRAGLTPVGQTRFGQDRQKLVERVPEARPYLFSRGANGAVGTRADGEAALANPAGAAALANSADPLAPLQPPAPETGAYT